MSPRVGLDQQTIIQTAIRLADEHGLSGVTLAAVAKACDVRTPSLYNHIRGLEALRTELSVLGMQALYRQMSQAAEDLHQDEAIHAVSRAYLAFARAQPGLYEASLEAPRMDHPELLAISRRLVDFMCNLMTPYALDEDASLHAVRGLRSLLHGFTSLEQQGGFKLPLDLDVTLTRLIDTFLAGIYKMQG
ncbi:TetR/AcrR family transcriptional regulator [Marinicrinis sediminis]|uniref:TetR/AcrR family transcriptional regulator n=1 Tax=Marinicrinis sediminis TaxID=1652465 RepID=A0ABW5RCV2_9BACL